MTLEDVFKSAYQYTDKNYGVYGTWDQGSTICKFYCKRGMCVGHNYQKCFRHLGGGDLSSVNTSMHGVEVLDL